MNTLKTMRNALLVAIAFAGVGWFGGWRFEHANAEYQMSIAERGYCVARDVAKTRYFYNCQDAAVQFDLQAREAQRDADTSAILDQMRVNQPKKVGGKR